MLEPLLSLPPPLPGVAKWPSELRDLPLRGSGASRGERDASSVAEGGVRARLGTRLPGCGGDGRSQRHQLVHREGLDPESAVYILELHERLLRVVKTQPSARPEDGQPEEVNGTHSDQDEEKVGLLERSGEEEEEEEEEELRESALLARRGEWKASRKVLSELSKGLESAERDETNAEIQEGDELSEEDQDSEVDTQGQDWEGGEGWADADYEELKDEEGIHEDREEERTTSCQ